MPTNCCIPFNDTSEVIKKEMGRVLRYALQQCPQNYTISDTRNFVIINDLLTCIVVRDLQKIAKNFASVPYSDLIKVKILHLLYNVNAVQ